MHVVSVKLKIFTMDTCCGYSSILMCISELKTNSKTGPLSFTTELSFCGDDFCMSFYVMLCLQCYTETFPLFTVMLAMM